MDNRAWRKYRCVCTRIRNVSAWNSGGLGYDGLHNLRLWESRLCEGGLWRYHDWLRGRYRRRWHGHLYCRDMSMKGMTSAVDVVVVLGNVGYHWFTCVSLLNGFKWDGGLLSKPLRCCFAMNVCNGTGTTTTHLRNRKNHIDPESVAPGIWVHVDVEADHSRNHSRLARVPADA